MSTRTPRSTPSAHDIVLVPGLQSVRRDPGALIVLGADTAVTLPDTESVRGLLADLAHGRAADAPDEPARRALARLVGAGLTETSAANRERAASRSISRVLVDAGEDDAVAGLAIELLLASGLAVTTRSERATQVLVVGAGEVARERVAPWVRRGIAHLVLVDHGPMVTVGPFVHPGQSSCLHCLDAHSRDRDPWHDDLVGQLVDAEPLTARIDPALRATAIGWAVRDLVTAIEGGRPSTWSATVRFRADASSGPVAQRQEWRRHPACGCAWADALRTDAAG